MGGDSDGLSCNDKANNLARKAKLIFNKEARTNSWHTKEK